MSYRKIFDKETDESEIMLIDVYFSGGASSVVDMIKNDNYGKKYKIRAAFAGSDDASGIEKLEKLNKEKKLGIEIVVLDQKKTYAKLAEEIEPALIDFCGRYYNADFRDEVLRNEYDRMALELMNAVPGKPHMACLSGYQRKLSPTALKGLPTTVNVHPARLSIVTNGVKTIDASNLTKGEIEEALGDKYWRLLTGENVVSRAINYGYDSVNASIHVVTDELDGGTMIVTSPRIIVSAEDAKKVGLQKYSDEVQNSLKRIGDSPAFCYALELAADGRLMIDDETKEILIDGEVPTYGGIQMEEVYRAVVADGTVSLVSAEAADVFA